VSPPTTTLARLMGERGLSLRGLGEYLDISHVYVAKLAAGLAPLSHDRARLAARALKCSPTELHRKHAAEHNFATLELSLKALDDLDSADEVLASRAGQRLVAKIAERLDDLACNPDLDGSLKSRAVEASSAFAEAVTKATSDARALVVTKRREDDDVATKALGGFGETDRPGLRHRDAFGRARTTPDLPRDQFGRRIRNRDGVDVHELNKDPDDERPAGRRAADSQTRRDVSGDYYRQWKSATKGRAEKNYVKGSLDWVRQNIEKQLDTVDASGVRSYGVWVREMFTDKAIVEVGGQDDVKSYPWAYTDGADDVELGEPSDVELESDYAAKAGDAAVPKRNRSMSKSTMKELGRDALGRRIRNEDE
jgi:transcriptional regulator with XRE-family HTH domain